MGHQFHRLCGEPNQDNRSQICGQWCHHWRQCPDKKCNLDIAYCDQHGGTDRATLEMTAHILEKHR